MNNKGIADLPCFYAALLDGLPDSLAAHTKVPSSLSQTEHIGKVILFDSHAQVLHTSRNYGKEHFDFWNAVVGQCPPDGNKVDSPLSTRPDRFWDVEVPAIAVWWLSPISVLVSHFSDVGLNHLDIHKSPGFVKTPHSRSTPSEYPFLDQESAQESRFSDLSPLTCSRTLGLPGQDPGMAVLDPFDKAVGEGS